MSFWEIFVILIVALVVIGPKQLPELAQKTGQFIRTMQNLFYRMSADVKNELHLQNNELRAKEADLKYTTDTKNTKIKEYTSNG